MPRSSLSRIWNMTRLGHLETERKQQEMPQSWTRAWKGFEQLKQHQSWSHRGGKTRSEQSSRLAGDWQEMGKRGSPLWSKAESHGVKFQRQLQPTFPRAAGNHLPTPSSWSSAQPARIPAFLCNSHHHITPHVFPRTIPLLKLSGVGLCCIQPKAKAVHITCKQETSLSDKPLT